MTTSPVSSIPHVTVGSSTGYSAYKHTITYPDSSQVDWYLGVFERNNSVSFGSALKDTDVQFLLVGGGGSGSGATNSGSASTGGGGGGGGSLLIETYVNSGALQIGTSYDVDIGFGGGNATSKVPGNPGQHTKFGKNVYGLTSCPDVSGGDGGTVVPSNAPGGIVSNNGSSVGFNVIADYNNGGSGGKGWDTAAGGAGTHGTASSGINGPEGDPNFPGRYYIGPNYGIFTWLAAGGGGGGGGGTYDPNATATKYGEGGTSGYFGTAGTGGLVKTVPPTDPNGGYGIASPLFGGSYTGCAYGAGGGGAGTPTVGNNSTGGYGAQGVLMFWLPIVTPASTETPYYTLRYANSKTVTVSNEVVYHDGSKKQCYTSVISGGEANSIQFKSDASGMSADFLLVGAGGGGGGATNQQFTYPGGGGGGGGHFLGRGEIGGGSKPLIVGTQYDIETGPGGGGAGGANPGDVGEDSYFGRNVWSPFAHVTAGKGGPSKNSSTPPDGGVISSIGPLTQLFGGNGGSGGLPSDSPGPTSGDGFDGVDAAKGNADISGLYVFEGYGPIGVGGGGGGGGGVKRPFFKYPDVSGEGGAAGFGLGGKGGLGQYFGTDYNGGVAPERILSSLAEAGGGGGGGGVPYDGASTNDKQSFGGKGADGLWAVHMEVDIPAPPGPEPGEPITNPYFIINNDQDTFVQEITIPFECDCPPIYPEQWVVVTTIDNSLQLLPAAEGMDVAFILAAAGGQGTGSLNSVVKQAGRGGGGAGSAFISGTVGPDISTGIWYDIEIGTNPGTGGFGLADGSNGGESKFGDNVWPTAMMVTGGRGNGLPGTSSGYPPFPYTAGGNGGNGGEQLPSGDGEQGGNAPTLVGGLFGQWMIPGYGSIYVAGAGGGGAGITGEDRVGSGGEGGRGTGGAGGTLDGTPPDGQDAVAVAQAAISSGGGGGGGSGIPSDTEAITYGGNGAKGLFAMLLTKQGFCPPRDKECGCTSPVCPKKVDYTPFVTGGNDPKWNPAEALAMYIRGSVGRPGYRKVEYGNNTLDAVGTYDGAASGSRAPPRNKFN